ncbi:hypothetical protein L1F30_17380 [Simiduia sp. 21SJ11W-1]|uniref:hypothetical protein n=1 Tax=Simiduia sp. 21SJ11W-1 TaxID=2909669 RepID=UPI00209D1E4A|nr:hypothetical protein [Simiduia sp. 21SJ11W-1]UTA47913.1 hypothetical protein L1F30_17380 [Simiduia sp. 21SJ11W-1]
MFFQRTNINANPQHELAPTAEELRLIRAAIAQAVETEGAGGLFLKVLRKNFDKLHSAIALMGQDGQPLDTPDNLLAFVVAYIRHVPDFMDAVNKIGELHNIQTVTTPFLRIIGDFFLSPPELVEGHTGLDALLDEAYLAHRIIEEVNDHLIARFGIPLAPMDMTSANLVVHSLIGEPFANDLDHAVQYSVEMLMMRGKPLDQQLGSDAFKKYVGKHQQQGWGEELKLFPCLASDLSVELHFPHRRDGKSLH